MLFIEVKTKTNSFVNITMDFLLSDWIDLFDDKNFECIENVPKELKSLTMLFVTLQKEFKTVECFLSKKLKILQTRCETKNHENGISDVDNGDILFIESSPPKENKCITTQNIKGITKAIVKSPTFSRHRKKLNLKKIKSNFSSEISPLKSSSNVHTRKVLSSHNRINNIDTIEDSDILDCSVIDITPNINFVKKTRGKFLSPIKRLKSVRVLKESTLTQIFSDMVTGTEHTKDDTSMMGIEEIIDKIDTEKSVDPHKSLVVQENFSGSNVSEDIKVMSFVKGYDKIPELPKSPSKRFIYKETVRGNEKKKLKGWSCKECENFYKDMNLPEKELEKKMDECSKHRSRFKPDEETMPGYWDLSIPPTPEDQQTQTTCHSNQESIGNDSTIFCFYKN